MTAELAEDLATAPGEKIVRIEVAPVTPCSRIIGGLSIDSRFSSREEVCDHLHALVEEILDKIYPPPPREAAEETIINDIRKGKLRLCK